ncbi:apolipoprotein A1/A4/E family protein [Ruminococcaceae bacterium OttesenSCG-928-L11]|nr:apolipoprotein A1/A4/E family protein [Ruminococcaceae bacterium OttesenSCG-928-L11]
MRWRIAEGFSVFVMWLGGMVTLACIVLIAAVEIDMHYFSGDITRSVITYIEEQHTRQSHAGDWEYTAAVSEEIVLTESPDSLYHIDIDTEEGFDWDGTQKSLKQALEQLRSAASPRIEELSDRLHTYLEQENVRERLQELSVAIHIGGREYHFPSAD